MSAEAAAAVRRLEQAARDVLDRDVVDGRMACLEHPVCAGRVGDHGSAEHYTHTPGGKLEARRPRVIPDRLGDAAAHAVRRRTSRAAQLSPYDKPEILGQAVAGDVMWRG